MRSRIAAGIVLATLALPAAASAHPGVYTVTQKLANGTETYAQDPTGANLTSRTQYAVANDGWALGFTEDNTNPGGGLIDYKAMPSSWRAPMTPDQKRTFAGAQTSLQAHATCSGTALDGGPNILAWQGNDPFFNYVPFQSTSAGLGDEPSKWIPVVKTATGVDLTGMTAGQAQAACTGLGGTYRKADTPSNIADALLASIAGPLQSQITQLQNQVGVLQAGKAASDAALLNRPLALTLSAKKFDIPVVMVTGLPGTAVTVRVLVRSADAKRLKTSRTAAIKTKALGGQGAELFTLAPSKKVAASRRALKVTIEAAGGGKTLTSKGTLR